MERLNNRLNHSGQTYETSNDLRLSNRPQTHNQNAFGSNPSTLGSSKKDGGNGVRNGVQSSQTRPKFKPAMVEQHSSTRASSTTSRLNARKAKPQSSDESSEDEMDLLSESSQWGAHDDASSSQKLVSFSKNTQLQKSSNSTSTESSRPKQKSKSEDVYIDKEGKIHKYHPDFKPVPNKYASLSFTKSKTKDSTTLTEKQADPSSSSRRTEPMSKENTFPSLNGPSSWSPIRPAPSSQNMGKAQDDVVDLSSSPPKSCDDNNFAPPSPLSGKSTMSNRGQTPPPLHNRDIETSIADDSRGRLTKQKLRPIPIRRGAPKATDVGENRAIVDVLGLRPQSRKSTSPDPSSPRNKSTERSQLTSKKLHSELKPAPFPLDSADFLASPQASSKKPAVRSSVRAKPFPLLQATEKDESQAITTARTAQKAQTKGKGKGKAKNVVHSTDDEDGEEGEDKARASRPLKPKAFPMSNTDWSPGSPLPRPSKRNSDCGSEHERTVKKSRKGQDHLLGSPSGNPFYDEGDSISLAPQADPKTLCPFCDISLPHYPSPLFKKLLEETKKKASKDPRPSNPLGLRAPLAAYITLCRRHIFESQILPEAERKGWPKTIKWKKVSGRVLKMKDFLQALIEDTGSDVEEKHLQGVSEWEIIFDGGSKTRKGKGKAKGPKASSVFWVEMMAEIEKKGRRAVTGVREQYANFEKAQPGYYGEMGSVIIYQTLYNMFSPTEIDPHLVSPLTPTEFIQRILVPEVALHLIMEDQDLDGEEGMEKALKILRDSSSYGVAMFPEDGGEWGENKGRDQDKMGEADLIVMERAKKRRKELKEEEEREEEELRRHYEEDRKLKGAQDRGDPEKAKKSQRGRTERQPSVSLEPVAERPRPRPVSIKKSKSVISSSTPASEDEIHQGNGRWTRSKSRSRSITSDESDLEKDNTRRPSSEERRRSPSASESRPQEGIRRAIPSRAPSHDMARLYLGPDDAASDSSTRALVNGEWATSSQSMKVDSGDSEVEFVDNAKTPIPNRPTLRTAVRDDATPRPDRSRKPDRSKETMAPLERARQRNGTSKPGPSKNSPNYLLDSPNRKKYGWLLDYSSSQ